MKIKYTYKVSCPKCNKYSGVTRSSLYFGKNGIRRYYLCTRCKKSFSGQTYGTMREMNEAIQNGMEKASIKVKSTNKRKYKMGKEFQEQLLSYLYDAMAATKSHQNYPELLDIRNRSIPLYNKLFEELRGIKDTK